MRTYRGTLTTFMYKHIHISGACGQRDVRTVAKLGIKKS